MTPSSIQLDADGRLRHFLTVEGLKRRHLVEILDRAEALSGVAERRMTKSPTLHGKTVVNLFFENSTRTRTTFELAAKRLSADVLNVNISTSSTHKGETRETRIREFHGLNAAPVLGLREAAMLRAATVSSCMGEANPPCARSAPMRALSW